MKRWKERLSGRMRRRIGMPVMALLLLLVMFAAFPGQAQASTKIKGIDVSKWQGKVDWESVADDGIKFVMLGTGWYGRKTSGVQEYDPYFTTNIQGALDAGLKVGVYRLTYSTTVAEMREEAYQVLDLISGYKISYPVALDMEASCYLSMTKAERTELALAFLEVIEEAGYYPIIYASNYWFTTYLDRSALSDYDYWVATWSASPTISPVSMWQYSSTGKVSGINTAVDLDYSYKDYSKIITPRTRPLITRTSTTGWQTDGTNYWYRNSSGKILKKTWLTLNGKKYYLASSGYRVTGWAKISSKYYYFNSSGELQTGWLTLNGKTYYLRKKSSPVGQRATGWTKINSKYYYFNSSGVMQTGWTKVNKKYYYLDPDTGVRVTGWLTVDGKTYYLRKKSNPVGQRATGWTKINSKYYYFNSSGVMQTGWVKVSGKYYYLDPETGVRVTGWLTVDENTYYLKKKSKPVGQRSTGWTKIGGKYYYFNSSGVMQTGWVKVSGKYYYLDPETGVRVTGWVTIDGDKYYLKKNSKPVGQRATGWTKINGKYYYFDSSGVMQKSTTIGKYTLNSKGVCTNR